MNKNTSMSSNVLQVQKGENSANFMQVSSIASEFKCRKITKKMVTWPWFLAHGASQALLCNLLSSGNARAASILDDAMNAVVSFLDHMGVSENGGTPKSSILTGFPIINHPFWDTTIFGNTHMEVAKKNMDETLKRRT